MKTESKYNINAQLLKLVQEDGLSIEEAADLLQLDADGARLALAAISQDELTAEELIQKHRPTCIQVLVDIATNEKLENTSARVAAAKIIVEGRGNLPELAADKFSEMCKKMKNVTAKYDEELAAHKANINKTTVIIENPNVTKSTNFDKKFEELQLAAGI